MTETDWVILNGWAMPESVWEEWLPVFEPTGPVRIINMDAARTLDEWMTYLEAEIPRPASIIGWSLGGMLALAFAHKFPARVVQLALLASTPCFVKKEGWQDAQPESMIENMVRLVSVSSASLIRRFAMLQTLGGIGAQSAARLIERKMQKAQSLESTAGIYHREVLIAGLELLSALDLRKAYCQVEVPVLTLLGGADQVVKVSAQALRALNSSHSVVTLPGMGHYPFLDFSEETAQACVRFFRSPVELSSFSNPQSHQRERG